MNEHLKRSRKQEKRGAKKYNGSRNAGSGNGSRKNDVRTDEWSIEFKTTTKGSYSLRLEDLKLAERNAVREHRRPLFGIDFAGTDVGDLRYVVLVEWDVLRLVEQVDDLRQQLLNMRDERDYWHNEYQWSLNSE